ncbi:MAG: DUF6036 family nucleotidyltransferase [bacterium]
MNSLSKEKIVQYLEDLSHELGKKHIKGEILLFGGAAMVLAFNARPSTKDVDAIFRPKNEIYSISHEIAKRNRLPEGWLNDSVKGFLERNPLKQNLFIRFENLSVYIPEPEYLLAMKCISMRIGIESTDIDDIKFLITHLKLKNADNIFKIIEKYYPHNRIPQKTYYAINEILQKILTHSSH